MNQKLRIGIVGCGSIAMSKHLPAIAANSGIAGLAAVCDSDRRLADRLAQACSSDVKVYGDYSAMLENPDIDVIHVCTPNAFHGAMSIAALEAGKHVLCEKPIAADAHTAEQMIEASRRTGKKLSISHQNRFREDSQAIYEACRKGMLGEIYFAKAFATRRKSVPTWGAFTSKRHQGGGPLIDVGVHALDLALWFMDNYEVESVTGNTYNKLKDHPEGNIFGEWDPAAFEVEDSAFGYIKMKNGATIFLESAWALHTTKPREAMTSLYGTLGGAEQLTGEFGHGSFTYEINTILNGRMVTIQPDPPYRYSWRMPKRANELMEEAPQLEFARWFSAIIEDRQPDVLPEQALVVCRVLDAIYASAESGKSVYF